MLGAPPDREQPSVKVEASGEETATVLGVEGTSIVTYTAHIKADGSLDGEGEVIFCRTVRRSPNWRA